MSEMPAMPGVEPEIPEPDDDPYDMAAFLLRRGGLALTEAYGSVRSIVNVRDQAVIVLDHAVCRVRWDTLRSPVGFVVEMVCHL